jgi:hypothetical protein
LGTTPTLSSGEKKLDPTQKTALHAGYRTTHAIFRCVCICSPDVITHPEPCPLWRTFRTDFRIFRRFVCLLRRGRVGQRQSLYLETTAEHRRRITNIDTSSGIRNHDPGVRAARDQRLTEVGHCHRRSTEVSRLYTMHSEYECHS